MKGGIKDESRLWSWVRWLHGQRVGSSKLENKNCIWVYFIESLATVR